MPIGAGLSPAGLSSAGYGVPDSGTSPINALLPDLFTGLPQTGRFINPGTGSIQFTADGRVVGFGTVPQLVTLVVETTLGTCAIPTLGQDVTKIQEKSANYAQQVRTKLSVAFASLIKQGLLSLSSIDVTEPPDNPDSALVLVRWRDLTNNTENVTTIGP